MPEMIRAKKKSQVDLATVKCQKCLEYGHYNYECKNKRKIVIRESRTKILQKNLTKPAKSLESKQEPPKKKPRKVSASSSSSSSSSSGSESLDESSDSPESSSKSSDSDSSSSDSSVSK